MKILSEKRCNIGEGPIWNEGEGKLYYTNGGGGNALCIIFAASLLNSISPKEKKK